MTDHQRPARPGTGRSSTLLLAAALVGLEAVGLLGVVGLLVLELAVADFDDLGRVLVIIVLALAAGSGLALVARGLLASRAWARSPALVANLLVLPVAVGLLQGGRADVGVPLLAVAVAVIGLLFAPATSAALADPDQAPPAG